MAGESEKIEVTPPPLDTTMHKLVLENERKLADGSVPKKIETNQTITAVRAEWDRKTAGQLLCQNAGIKLTQMLENCKRVLAMTQDQQVDALKRRDRRESAVTETRVTALQARMERVRAALEIVREKGVHGDLTDAFTAMLRRLTVTVDDPLLDSDEFLEHGRMERSGVLDPARVSLTVWQSMKVRARVRCLCFDPDNHHRVYIGYDSGIVTLWDLNDTPREIETFTTGVFPLLKIVICHLIGMKMMITAGEDKTVRVWNLAKHDCIHVFAKHSGQVLALLTTDRDLYTAAYDRTVLHWDLNRERPLGTVIHTHGSPIHCACFLMLPEPSWTTPALFMVTSTASTPTTPNPASGATIAPGGAAAELLGAKLKAPGAKSIRPSSREALSRPTSTASTTSSASSSSAGGTTAKEGVKDYKDIYNQDRWIATGHRDGNIILFPLFGKLPSDRRRELRTNGHTNTICCLWPHGDFLFSGSEDCAAIQWDLRTGNNVRVFRRHVDAVVDIRTTSHGLLITASKDALIMIWNIFDGALVNEIHHHYHFVWTMLLGDWNHTRPEDNVQTTQEALVTNRRPSTSRWCADDEEAAGPLGPSPFLITGSFDKTFSMWHIKYDPPKEE